MTPDEAVALSLQVKELEKTQRSVIFKGITGYEGHTPVLPPPQKAEETKKAHGILAEARRKIEAAGLKVEIVIAIA